MPRLKGLRLLLNLEAPRKGRFSFALPLYALGSIAFLMAWLAPNHYPPWTSFHGEAAAFAALIAFCIAAIARNEQGRPENAYALFLVLVGLVWAQWAAGQIIYVGDATISSLYLVGLGLAWWLGSRLNSLDGETDNRLMLLAALLVAAALISTLIAILQWLRLEATLGIFAAERGPSMRPFGNLGQPNHLATLTLVGIVLSCGLFARRYLNAWQLGAVIAVLSFGLILTESRTGILTAALIGAGSLAGRRYIQVIGGWKAIAGWWALLLGLLLAWRPLNETLFLQAARDAEISQDTARMVMWRQAVSAIAESPWIGYGWRQTAVAQKTGANAVEGSLATEYAHNLALDLILWMGIPAGVFLIGLIGYWMIRAAMRINCAQQLLLFLALVPLAVHSLTEFPFAYSYFLFPAGWMLGALSTQQNIGPAAFDGVRLKLARVTTALILTMFATVSAWTAFEYIKAEEDYRVMRFELRNVGSNPVAYAAPELFLLDQISEMLKLGRMVPYPGMPQEDIERLRKGSTTFTWAAVHMSYSMALALNGQPAEASRQLHTLRSLYGPDVYRQVKEILLQMQQARYPQLAAVSLP